MLGLEPFKLLEGGMDRRWIQAIAVSLAATGCNARVETFEAEPRVFCPGQPVVVRWGAVGSAELTFAPPIAGVPGGPVASSGELPVHPTRATRASLRVTRMLGEPTGADVDLDVPRPVRIAADLNGAARCEHGVLTLTARLTQQSPDVRAELVTVEDSEQRSYDVVRLDAAQRPIQAHVARGVSTTAFASLPIAGDWVLSSPLVGSEACPTDGGPGNIPHVLVVYAYAGCQGAKS
jgi:hypothetical protein